MSRGSRQHRRFGRLAAIGGTFLILSSLLLSVGASAAIAADTGAKAPGGTAAPNGWTDASKAIASDDVYATARGDNVDQGYDGFGIDLPNGSIVDGISVAVEGKSSDATGCELQVALSSGGSFTSNQTQSLGEADATLSFGGASDDWGRVWDPTQIDDLVVRVRANDPGSECNDGQGGTATASVDSLAVTVTYRTVKGGDENPTLSKGVCNQADFAFVIDMSGSIGPQDGRPSNLPQLKAGITDFVSAFADAGGDGRYSGTRFNGTSASAMTSGFDSASAFSADVDALSGPTGTTPTAAGITTGRTNDSGDRAGVPNVMFVVTDGSPNVPGGDLGDPATWLQAANAAVDAADAARGDGYVVKAIYLSTAGDPGDTTLPFSDAGDAAWAKKVMQEIGGGSYLSADFKSFVDDLFKAIKCSLPPTVTLTKEADPETMPEPGGDFTFKLTIHNTADHAVEITALTDDNDLSKDCLDLIGTSLGAGDKVSCTYKVEHTKVGTYPNTASVTVKDSDGGTASDEAKASVKVTDVPPTITVDKQAEPDSMQEPGGDFTFKVAVTNTSDEPVTITSLSDDVYGDLDEQGDCKVGAVLDPGATYECAFQGAFQGLAGATQTDVVTATAVDDEGTEASAKDDATVGLTEAPRPPAVLTIVKDVENTTTDRGQTAQGWVLAIPGDSLHYTLAWELANGPLHGVTIKDVLPAGLGTPSNISDGGSWDAGSRTITWDLGTVEANGSVSYDVVVASDADLRPQPLENVATIDSDETSPDDDIADTKVVAGGGVETETSKPKPTLPPTDAIGPDGNGGPGSGLILVLFALAGLALGASFLTPAPARARNRGPRR